VLEDLLDDRRAVDQGDDFHSPAAMGTEQRIDLVDLTNQARPRSEDLQARPMVRARDWVRRFGIREQPVLLAVALRAIGVPLLEKCWGLTGLSDVGTTVRTATG
jgi:hypothetical protein